MQKREVTVEEAAKAIEGLTVISGVSGSGKDWFVDQITIPKDLKFIKLDSIGERIADKWMTKLPQLEGVDVVMGTSDNMIEVVKTLKQGYEEGEPLTLIWIKPSARLLSATTAAKARDHATREGGVKKGEPDPWIKGWLDKSKMNPAEAEKYLNSKLELLISQIKPDEVLVVLNDAAKVTDGWHKASVKQDSNKN